MACLSLSNGSFYNSGSGLWWRDGSVTETLADGVTTAEIDLTASSPGLTVTNSSTSTFIALPPSGDLKFMAYGGSNKYLLAMTADSGGGNNVYHINVADGSLDVTNIGSYTRSSSVPPPSVWCSPTQGDLFVIVMTDGTTFHNVACRRSDNGDSLIWMGSFTPTGIISAEVTSTHIYVYDASITRGSTTRPEGESDVSPNTQNFPDIVLGSGVDPSLSSHEEQFTIENDGTDCLVVSAITDGTNFSVSGTSSSLPVTLDPGERLTVDVEFNASSVGSYSESLPISLSPSNGDTTLDCEGDARNANLSLSYSSNVNFGKVPLSSTSTRSVDIRNNGEADATLNIPASGSGSVFSWPAYSGTLSPGDTHTLDIEFSPAAETTYSGSVSFTSSAYSSSRTINLEGEGCVANAVMNIDVPTGPYIDLGEVQEGFRTVAIVRVQNTGDGTLNFDVGIDGADASLFGIQKENGSITSPLSDTSFSIDPVSACGGSSGSGEVSFAVTFFADDSPGTYNAELVFDNHNDSSTSATITHDLQAEIIEGVKVDAQLVMDRSGSMGDPSGGEIKSEVAINAGQLFVELLRPDVEDRVGITRFNETPDVVSSIQDITSANQESIAADINSTNLNPTGATCIAGGVRVAEKDMDNNPRSTTPADLNSVIVVLTDGLDNRSYTDPDDGVTYSLLGEDGDTPLPAPTGKKLYAVGIGDSIDTARLSVLANETSGDYLHVTDFSGTDLFSLEKYYTQIFMDSVDLAVISDPVYHINPNQTHTIPFDILQGDTGLMIVIYDKDLIRIPFYLQAPDGTIVDVTTIPSGFQLRSGITTTARFIELKFPPGETTRYAGVWKVILRHNGKACIHSGAAYTDLTGTHDPDCDFGFGFAPDNCDNYDKPIMYGIAIGAGSNFRMTPFVEPGIVSLGDPIKLNALISEFGLPVTGCNVTVEVESPRGTTYNYTLHDDGAHEDDDADDGNYGKVFTQTYEEGTYNFTFRASGQSRDGEPVQREAVRSKYVEGSAPLVPEGSTVIIPEGGSNGDDDKDDCCSKITKFLYGILVILVAILASLWWLNG